MKDNKNESLLAMPLFKNGDRMTLVDVIEHLSSFWNLKIRDLNGDNDTFSFLVNENEIVIAFADYCIPKVELESSARYNQDWENLEREIPNIDSHCIVYLIDNSNNTKEACKTLSMVLCSILLTSNSIGVYQGSQTLLLSKNKYLSYVQLLKENIFPVPLWIYFGFRQINSKFCGYTFGLNTFKKLELELIDTDLTENEIYEYLYNISSYVIENNIKFKSGSTIGYDNENKIELCISKGHFLKGKTIKLSFFK